MRALPVMLLFPLASFAGVIPPERTVDWSIAGYPGALPRPALQVDVTGFGAKGDGKTADQGAIAAAIKALGGQPGVVYFPAGSYRITAAVSIPSGVILRGAGPTTARIACDPPNSGTSCLVVGGSTVGAFRPVTGGLTKGSTQLTMADTAGLASGDWVELRQANGTWDIKPASWATHVVGQVVRLTAVTATTLTLEDPLRISYDPSLGPELIEVNPAHDVGIEDLGIDRVTDPTPTAAGNNISFTYAVRSWVAGVDSKKSIGSHVGIFHSSQIEVTGSAFQDAYTFDGTSTRGYGVTLNNHTGACLIEGNVFSHLRHAMMAKTGANGNVFAYNFSRDPFRSEVFNDFAGDISLHGHYAFANLFEGNVVANIIVDQYWGPSGPHNTFFRNRAEWYGIIITPDNASNDQNFVGNEVTKGKSNALLGLAYTLYYGPKGTGHFEYGNNVAGKATPSGTEALSDVSYYRPVTADFCELAAAWPSIGYPMALAKGTNRARSRWDASWSLTYRALWTEVGPDVAILDGESVTIKGHTGGGAAPIGSAWSPVAGLATPSAALTLATPAMSTTYAFTTTDALGCTASDALHATVNGTVATPVIAPESGTVLTLPTVTITVATLGATIHVTIDGTEPTEASLVVAAPFALTGAGTVRARAFRPDFVPSAIATAVYTLDPDECALETDGCSANAVCTNQLGTFACACLPGYHGDGVSCEPKCGDGIPTIGEACDDGDTDETNACLSDCTVNVVLPDPPEADAGVATPEAALPESDDVGPAPVAEAGPLAEAAVVVEPLEIVPDTQVASEPSSDVPARPPEAALPEATSSVTVEVTVSLSAETGGCGSGGRPSLMAMALVAMALLVARRRTRGVARLAFLTPHRTMRDMNRSTKEAR